MTEPVDITDPAITKAFAHPLRIEILALLEDRVASPAQLATELSADLSQTSYHVRQLKGLGLVRLVRRRMTRGAVEHLYTATVRPTITDSAWSGTSTVAKRALAAGRVAQIGREVSAAAERNGFARDGVYVARTRMRLSPKGWRAVSRELGRALERIDRIVAEEREAFTTNPTAEAIEAAAVMLFFESPPPESFDPPPVAEGEAQARSDRHQ